MRNHDQKIKDMAESVLPSTGRITARRTRARLHRRTRRAVNQSLHVMSGYDDVDDFDRVLDRSTDRDVEEMIEERRLADKVGPITRWAARRVAIDPHLVAATVEEQLAYFRRLLPDNTGGRHALGHIRETLERGPRRRWRPDAAGHPTDAELALRADVRLLVVTGLHRELNARLKRAGTLDRDRRPWVQSSRAPRLLGGLHDVDDFAHDVVHRAEGAIVRGLVQDHARIGTT